MTPEPPLELPSELSDEAAAQLIECLYEFARYLEQRYCAQLQRYYHPEQPWPQPVWDDDPPF